MTDQSTPMIDALFSPDGDLTLVTDDLGSLIAHLEIEGPYAFGSLHLADGRVLPMAPFSERSLAYPDGPAEATVIRMDDMVPRDSYKVMIRRT